jgi:hypothetical protein
LAIRSTAAKIVGSRHSKDLAPKKGLQLSAWSIGLKTVATMKQRWDRRLSIDNS